MENTSRAASRAIAGRCGRLSAGHAEQRRKITVLRTGMGTGNPNPNPNLTLAATQAATGEAKLRALNAATLPQVDTTPPAAATVPPTAADVDAIKREPDPALALAWDWERQQTDRPRVAGPYRKVSYLRHCVPCI